MENNITLEAMKSELASLKEKLDRQTIISEEHIRRSMKDKVGRIKTQTAILGIIGVAGIVYCSWVLHMELGLSLALTLFTDIFLAAAIFFSIWSTRKIHPKDMMGENLISAGKEIALMTKRGRMWKKVAFPLLAVWFIWVVVETLNSGLENDMVSGFLIGCGCGLLGGIVCGMLYEKKQTAMINELLRDIDELSK